MTLASDPLTHAGAAELAARVGLYWQKRGYRVSTRIEDQSSARTKGAGGVVFGVRSDLVNGLPRDLVAQPMSVVVREAAE